MNNGDTVSRDKYGFEIGTASNKVAALIDKGATIEQLFTKGYSKHVIYGTRHKMKVAKGEPLDPRFSKKTPPGTAPVVQFHPETKAFRVHALIEAGKTEDEILAAGFTKPDLYAVRSQIKKKIEAGKPGKALVVAKEHGAKRLAAILQAATNGHAPAPRKGKSNGHAPEHFNVPVVEAIFHVPGRGEVPVFSSVDIFPQVYALAARKLGLLK